MPQKRRTGLNGERSTKSYTVGSGRQLGQPPRLFATAEAFAEPHRAPRRSNRRAQRLPPWGIGGRPDLHYARVGVAGGRGWERLASPEGGAPRPTPQQQGGGDRTP